MTDPSLRPAQLQPDTPTQDATALADELLRSKLHTLSHATNFNWNADAQSIVRELLTEMWDAAALRAASQTPDTVRGVQHGADFLMEQLDALGAHITYTACKAIVSKLLSTSPATDAAGDSETFDEWLTRTAAHALSSAAESRAIAPDSWGSGFDTGYSDALEHAKAHYKAVSA